MKEVDIAVVGGGLGGLGGCLALRSRGFNAHVFEAASALRTATSTVVALGPNAFTALEGLNPEFFSTLMPLGVKTLQTTRITRVSLDVDPVVTPVPNMGANQHMFRWATVQNTLATMLPDECVHCSHRATGYTEVPEEEGGGVVVHFRGQEDVRARFVVAADGVRSALRATMVPQDPGPRYLGHMNWNALLYDPDNKVAKVLQPGEVRLHANANIYASKPPTFSSFVIDAGDGYTFWQLRKECETPSWTTPAGGADASSASGSSKEGFFDRKAGHQDEKLPQLVGGGLGIPGCKERVLQMLAEAGYTDVIPLVEATPESEIFERATIDRVPLDELGAGMVGAGGRLVLLGDAAHAAHNGPGQGARMAFEDAHQIAEAFARHSSDLPWTRLSPDSAVSAARPHASGHATRDVFDSVAPAPTAGGSEEGSHGNGASNGHSAVPSSTEVAAELSVLKAISQEYNDVRLARVCRVQRVSAEVCGLPELRAKLQADAGAVEPAQRMERFKEMGMWLDKYPEFQSGHPDTKWWKPPSDSAAVAAEAEAAAQVAAA